MPDDFPKKEFFSYTPYIMGDTVYFSSGVKVIPYEVIEAYWMYERGVVKKDWYKEKAAKRVTLRMTKWDKDYIHLNIDCINRSDFATYMECGSYPNQVISRYSVSVGDSWNESFDNYALFRELADEITLYGGTRNTPKALIKRGVGIVWFEDVNGTKWTLVQ